jgi:hypothetical protein
LRGGASGGVAEPGAQTDKARETVKAFIARQLKA